MYSAHAGVRERLLETLASFRKLLHLGPHQPFPTGQTPTPISGKMLASLWSWLMRYSSISQRNWPGI